MTRCAKSQALSSNVHCQHRFTLQLADLNKNTCEPTGTALQGPHLSQNSSKGPFWWPVWWPILVARFWWPVPTIGSFRPLRLCTVINQNIVLDYILLPTKLIYWKKMEKLAFSFAGCISWTAVAGPGEFACSALLLTHWLFLDSILTQSGISAWWDLHWRPEAAWGSGKLKFEGNKLAAAALKMPVPLLWIQISAKKQV